MSFAVYLIGAVLAIVGLSYGASRMGISTVWITVGAMILFGLAIMAGITQTRQKDPPTQ